jgi:hypothetical protein
MKQVAGQQQFRVYAPAFWLLAMVLTSCGVRDAGSAVTPTVQQVHYAWALPALVAAADGVDGEIYQALQSSCDEPEKALSEKWQQSSGPRDVLLFAGKYSEFPSVELSLWRWAAR